MSRSPGPRILNYGFKLEQAGSGNTLPEKRADKNSSKWRIRAAQMSRSIYQHTPGTTPIDPQALPEKDDRSVDRQSKPLLKRIFPMDRPVASRV